MKNGDLKFDLRLYKLTRIYKVYLISIVFFLMVITSINTSIEVGLILKLLMIITFLGLVISINFINSENETGKIRLSTNTICVKYYGLDDEIIKIPINALLEIKTKIIGYVGDLNRGSVERKNEYGNKMRIVLNNGLEYEFRFGLLNKSEYLTLKEYLSFVKANYPIKVQYKEFDYICFKSMKL